MPEGDTIFIAARLMHQHLCGVQVAAVTTGVDHKSLGLVADRTVLGVESRGKHHLVQFDDGYVLHSHMGMTGSWHLYESDAPWRKPAGRAALSMSFANEVQAVCFSPEIIELLTPNQYRRHELLNRLGPDLLSDSVGVDAIVERLRVHDNTPLGEAVMNQSIVCGVGNVYKSETLFALGMDPFAPVRLFHDDELASWVSHTTAAMRRNLKGGPRRTRYRGDRTRTWVYGRSGERCMKCDARVQMRRQGDAGRSTYFCTDCQPARVA